jgi:TctA family transporter
MTEADSWARWQELVLSEQRRLSEGQDCVLEKVTKMNDRLTRMEERVTIRASLVGFLAGAVPVAGAIALRFLKP